MSDFHTQRRHDVDWLRVLAFILLIFYHIGMYYVADWGWHVKSQYQSEFLQYPMLLINQWRMPLIFFISGFALCMVEPKIGATKLFSIRFFRVLIPLILGMYLIVPPQAFYEAIANHGYQGTYWIYWLSYIDSTSTILSEMRHSPLGLVTWNHLWYLAYLWVYTLVYLVLRPIFTKVGVCVAQREISPAVLFLVPVALMAIYGLTLKPYYPKTNALTDDWYNHAIYFTVFTLGYLAAKSQKHWSMIVSYRRAWLIGALIFYSGLMWINAEPQLNYENKLTLVLVKLWVYANLWSWLLAVVGYAGAYLNRPSRLLNYLNEAILPWYILHQTVMIVLAVNIGHLALGGALESSAVVIGTFALCAGLYELIRRWKLTRFMFGMKLN